jgi:succinyl-CoA synthetase beta subunit
MVKFIDALYKAYIGSDASMFEITSFKTSDDKILAVDAKVNIDDTLYRQKLTLRCVIFLKRIN